MMGNSNKILRWCKKCLRVFVWDIFIYDFHVEWIGLCVYAIELNKKLFEIDEFLLLTKSVVDIMLFKNWLTLLYNVLSVMNFISLERIRKRKLMVHRKKNFIRNRRHQMMSLYANDFQLFMSLYTFCYSQYTSIILTALRYFNVNNHYDIIFYTARTTHTIEVCFHQLHLLRHNIISS